MLAACLALVPLSGTATAGQAPHTVVTDGKKLADIQSALKHGHATRAQRDALKVVLGKANTALTSKPVVGRRQAGRAAERRQARLPEPGALLVGE